MKRSGGFTDADSVASRELTQPPPSPIEGAAILLGACLALLICGGLLVYGSGRGFDLTDEVFYLIWARDPGDYQLVYQPFGYLLHPLFQLVGGDLQAYRLAGFAITAGAGAFLAASLRGASRNPLAFPLYGAAAALTIFYPWIVTPSYNSLANVGAMLTIAGILRALGPSPRARVTGALAAAVGLCLAAFGKPPLFAIAAVVILLTAISARGARIALLVSLALAAALMSLVLSPADVWALVARMSASQHVLGMTNTPLALPAKALRDWLGVPWPLVAAAIAAAGAIALSRSRLSLSLGCAALGLSLYYVASVAGAGIDDSLPDFLGLAITTAVAGYAGVVQRGWRADRFAIALLLLAPAAVAFGTFNNQWFQLNFSMAFPFLALFALAAADDTPWRRWEARAIAIAGPLAVLMLAARDPYSLPASISDQEIPIQPPLVHGTVLVDPETATFVRSARGLAGGALLIDLSGTGPGVGAVLGGRAPVLPWLNPATPQWADIVWSRLGAAERERAWFVVPVWPAFSHSAPAQWLTANRARFCAAALPPMTFWGDEHALQLLRPCVRTPGESVGAERRADSGP